MTSVFPFSALVGQEPLKRALLLGVIQPSLGGVLVRGTKGVAKSTSVRALAAILPPIEAVAGCPFQRHPGEVIADWPVPADALRLVRSVPLVELPLGATEDRVLGTLHLERALRGERTFEPGLLAAANRGILYIDEVNLLPDHLVDILLDAAAGGVHRVERDGLSLSHPARFLLVGTMNPEEGDLRPQLLDRFGLAVDVADLADPAGRAEVVRRRLAFEADPAAFAADWHAADVAEAERVVQAQRILPDVQISGALLTAISARCLAAGVEGLRADLTICKAACAWAAYQGRRETQAADIEAVAELALAHRRTRPPEPPPDKANGGHKSPGAANGSTRPNAGHEPSSSALPRGADAPHSPSQVFDVAGLFTAHSRPEFERRSSSSHAGRWRNAFARHSGPRSGSPRTHYESETRIAWAATLRTAAPHQPERGRRDSDRLILDAADLRFWPRRSSAGCLLFFVVDTSGSMAAWRRMRQTKAAILALLLQAYQHRDQIALLAFRGSGSELILPPARALRIARAALDRLPVGGTTPLADGLANASRFIRLHQRRQPRQPIWTVLLTDGRANVGAWSDTLVEARKLAALRTEVLVVDTETGFPRFARAADLAEALDARCVDLESVLGKPLIGRPLVSDAS